MESAAVLVVAVAVETVAVVPSQICNCSDGSTCTRYKNPFVPALFAEFAAVEAAAVLVVAVAVEAAAVVSSQICTCGISSIISTRYKRSNSSGSLC